MVRAIESILRGTRNGRSSLRKRIHSEIQAILKYFKAVVKKRSRTNEHNSEKADPIIAS